MTSASLNENEFKVDLLVRVLCYHKENITSLERLHFIASRRLYYMFLMILLFKGARKVLLNMALEQAVSTSL